MTEGELGAGSGVDGLFRSHATALLRLGVLLTGDREAAEELVQDAFVAFVRQPRPPQGGTELAYLRRTLFNLSHGRHRRLAVARRHPDRPPADVPGADLGVESRWLQTRVAAAVRGLPRRQRDCMVLRCYAEATDQEIAEALGISAGSVKKHLSRARATLARQLEELR